MLDTTLLPSNWLLKADCWVPSLFINLIDPELIYKCCQGLTDVPKSLVDEPGIMLPVTIWLPIKVLDPVLAKEPVLLFNPVISLWLPTAYEDVACKRPITEASIEPVNVFNPVTSAWIDAVMYPKASTCNEEDNIPVFNELI